MEWACGWSDSSKKCLRLYCARGAPCENYSGAPMPMGPLASPSPTTEQKLREAIQEACDLLTERKHGSPARSPAHNARLLLEAALSMPAAQDGWRGIESAPMAKEPKFETSQFAKVIARFGDGGRIESQRVEAHLLLAILHRMETKAPETGWLIEVSGPTYYGEQDDGIIGWTADHQLAIRFARFEDAQRVIRVEGFTAASAVEHQWG